MIQTVILLDTAAEAAKMVREFVRIHANMHPYFSQRNQPADIPSHYGYRWRTPVADVKIDDGIIKIVDLEVQDPKAALVLAGYPQVRWAEITRKAVKIGLGYLKGGERA